MIAVIVSLLFGGAECSTPAATNHISDGLTMRMDEQRLSAVIRTPQHRSIAEVQSDDAMRDQNNARKSPTT
jgi:hypothetical protein